MASAGKVTAQVAVQTKVGVGASSIAGGSVTLVAYALAIVGYIQGARDEATISAIAVGTISLITVLGGRYGQAIAAIVKRSSWGAPAPAQRPNVQSGSSTTAIAHPGSGVFTTPVGSAWTGPRPGAEVSLGAPRDLAKEVPAGSVPPLGDDQAGAAQ